LRDSTSPVAHTGLQLRPADLYAEVHDMN
jgi:hypothetical protein